MKGAAILFSLDGGAIWMLIPEYWTCVRKKAALSLGSWQIIIFRILKLLFSVSAGTPRTSDKKGLFQIAFSSKCFTPIVTTFFTRDSVTPNMSFKIISINRIVEALSGEPKCKASNCCHVFLFFLKDLIYGWTLYPTISAVCVFVSLYTLLFLQKQ